MDRRRIDSDSLFGADVRTVLEISMLSLLFSFEIKTSESAKVLLDHSLVHGSTPTDTFSVVMRNSGERTLISEIARIPGVSTETHEHHQSALLLIYRKMMFSIAVGIPGTFQGTADNASASCTPLNYIDTHCSPSSIAKLQRDAEG